MKRLNLSAVTDLAQLRLKAGTFGFLQDANKEIFAATIKALIGTTYSASVVYVLYGCLYSSVGSTGYIHDGAVFYNGEVYLVDDGFSYALGGGLVPMFKVVTSNDTLDPVIFTDSTSHNVHNVVKMGFVTDGSGIANYSAGVLFRTDILSNPNKLITKTIAIGDWNMDTTAGYAFDPGVACANIRSISVIIYNDPTAFSPQIFPFTSGGHWTYGNVTGYPTYVELLRDTSGIFDSASFSATSFNRGYITIQYAQ